MVVLAESSRVKEMRGDELWNAVEYYDSMQDSLQKYVDNKVFHKYAPRPHVSLKLTGFCGLQQVARELYLGLVSLLLPGVGPPRAGSRHTT